MILNQGDKTCCNKKYTLAAYVAKYCQTVADVKHPFGMFVKN